MKKVAFVGQPLAGKSSLVEVLARLYKLPERSVTVVPPNEERIRSSSGRVEPAGLPVTLTTTAGALFDKALVREIVLEGAAVVGYVFNPPIDGLGFPESMQWDDFFECRAQAEALGVGPDRVPWLAIVTKMELARTSAFQSLPPGLMGPLEVDSHSGLGVNALAIQILMALGQET